MKIDKFAGEKIRLISFFATCAVVSWHVPDSGGALKRWLCPILHVWSVPWFFFVSGVFFVYSVGKRTWTRFAIDKFRSLFIPYIVWCILGAIYLAFVKGTSGIDMNAVFALNRLHPIGDTPLWYIRTLMFFFTLAVPLWFLSVMIPLSERLQRVCFAVGMLAVLGIFKRFGINLRLGPGSSGFYFVIGVVLSDLATKFPMWSGLCNRKRIAFGLLLLLFAAAIRGIWFAMGYDYYKMGGTLIANCSVVAFIAALLTLTDFKGTIDFFDSLFGRFSKYNAFVYMSHNVLLPSFFTMVMGWGLHPDIVYLSLSLVMPFFFVFWGALLRKVVPSVYYVLTGYRG